MNKINFLNKFSSKENLNHCQLAQANPTPAPQQAQTQARARLGQFVEQAAVATCVRACVVFCEPMLSRLDCFVVLSRLDFDT